MPATISFQWEGSDGMKVKIGQPVGIRYHHEGGGTVAVVDDLDISTYVYRVSLPPGFLGGNKLLDPEVFTALLGMPEFILRLLVQPTFGRGIKCDRKPDSHFGTNTGLAVQHGA